ncbi:MAG: FxsA family protein [Gammaproteobacteria bacterium]
MLWVTGTRIGAFTTAILVVTMAIVGAVLLPAQGFSTLRRVQVALQRGEPLP